MTGPSHSHSAARSFSKTCDRWNELCAQYLPIVPPDSFWRLSRFHDAADPAQGWKLHVSATLLSATKVLERVGPFLKGLGVLFKVPKALNEIGKLNCGMHYGYTQIGKCLTVYPCSVEEAISLAEHLHELTAGCAAPVIPFDRRFKPDSCVYYRFGPFKRLRVQNGESSQMLALRGPEGTLVPDCRESVGVELSGGPDPFKHASAEREQAADTQCRTPFRVFRALVQRGKGGVYQAIDLSDSEPRLCILKEGRRHGEVGWDGRDGFWRIKNERKVLSSLTHLGVDAPRVYGAVEVEDNFYLAIEFIPGQSLDKLLRARQRRLPISMIVKYATRLAGILSRLHSAGWVWRDCKPSNLIMSEAGRLRPIDFEGACRVNQPNPLPLGTPEFLPTNYKEELGLPAHPSTDLYAMGVVIYYLVTGTLPLLPNPLPVRSLRKNVPSAILQILSDLMHPEPGRRPGAGIVMQRLNDCLNSQIQLASQDSKSSIRPQAVEDRIRR